MRRRHAHALFAAAVVSCALAAAMQAARLQQAASVNRAIAAASVPASAPEVDADEAGEARFARAAALAEAGRYEEAVDAYKGVARSERASLRRAALFNLGNLHLREGQRREASDATQALALYELSKQSYRDLLREDPNDWDARYNLERALWQAPEADDAEEEQAAPQQSERAVTTMKGGGGELP
jgi:mxaK protein